MAMSFGGLSIETETDWQTSFVGRKKELRQIGLAFLKYGERVVVIVGSRGQGRTALARKFASDYSNEFDGVIRIGQTVRFGSATSSDLPVWGLDDESLRALEKSSDRPKPSLLIWDDIDGETQSRFDTAFERLHAGYPSVRFLLISSGRYKHRLFDLIIRLENLSRSEFRELVRRRFGFDFDSDTYNKLYAQAVGNPSAVEGFQYLWRYSQDLPRELQPDFDTIRGQLSLFRDNLSLLKPFKHTGLVGPDGKPIGQGAYRAIVSGVKKVNTELLARLDNRSALLSEISPRDLEEIVGELFHKEGFEVQVTPYQKDGGIDLRAARSDRFGRFIFLVQCKRNAPNRPVGVAIARELYGVVAAENATRGLVVTTSYFTKGARAFQQEVEARLSLMDYLGLRRWLDSMDTN